MRYGQKAEDAKTVYPLKFIVTEVRREKFEFADKTVHHVTSQRVEIDGKYYALEGATGVQEETVFTAIDKGHFIRAITENNKKLYIDPLTDAYSRRFFDEQLS